MAIDREFLELLACPVCREALEYIEKDNEEYLVCTGCRKHYPIENGIPVLLPDAGKKEAELEDEDE